mgnify:CR=1 FL=1
MQRINPGLVPGLFFLMPAVGATSALEVTGGDTLTTSPRAQGLSCLALFPTANEGPVMNRLLIAACAVLSFAWSAVAAKVNRATEMQYGPHQFTTLKVPVGKDNYTYKGAVIKIGENAYVCFDTELMRYAAGWSGGYHNFKGVSYDGSHGGQPSPVGTIAFTTSAAPGVASPDGKFDDPREHKPYGPLPRAWAKYKGLYHHGDTVLIRYSVGDADVLEMPGYSASPDAFSRTIALGESDRKVTFVLFEGEGGKATIDGKLAVYAKGDQLTAAGVISLPDGAALRIDDHRVLLDVPARKHTSQFIINIASLKKDQLEDFRQSQNVAVKMLPIENLTKGGPRLWKEKVKLEGKLGDDKKGKEPYVVDTIPVPFDNPYKSWMRTGGFDFFSDGMTAAVSTWNGDVWIVRGIDDTLKNIEWSRFACGVHDGLGLKIVDDKVYVHGREGITRLHDLNNDGQADFYECFNNDVMITHGFHEFQYELHTDKAGNFYFVKGGAVRGGGRGWEVVIPHHGCVFKLSPDGKKLEVIADGLRAPNGMGVGPNGEITTGDNEGTWVPKCRINYWTQDMLAKRRGFGGVLDLSFSDPKPTTYDPPICWMPKNVCNSGGGQTWVTSDRWGPFAGDLLYASYGKCTLYKVLKEEVKTADGVVPQGGVVSFPLRFDSGTCRLRFNERDGQLYVVGIKGWQSSAARDGSFQRVRYTGAPVRMPTSMKVLRTGIAITCTDKLDKELAEDTGSYAIEQWNYRWTSAYGSDHYKPSDPNQKGMDTLVVKKATLAADGKTVFLAIEDVKPVMQMKIRYNLESDGGDTIKGEIHNTINTVGDDDPLATR